MPYAARVRQIAREIPDQLALVVVPVHGDEQTLTWSELLRRSEHRAKAMATCGVSSGSVVVVALPSGTEHVVTSVATWLLGACVLPLNASAPPPERDGHLELAEATLVVADWPDVPVAVTPTALDRRPAGGSLPTDPMPEPGKMIGTGGSTGRPKLITDAGGWGYSPDLLRLLAGFGWRTGLTHLVPGPLYHSFGFDWCYYGLLSQHTVVLLERFDAERAVSTIERHRVQYVGLVPTMMLRIAQLPGIGDRDLSSLDVVMHTAAACPPWVKRAWIDLVGGKTVIEGYGASEGYGNTVIDGDEWLTRPGSVGRPFSSELRILDETGSQVPPGVVGEVFMRRSGHSASYVGALPPATTGDGFTSVGDLGWVDEAGYLYLADRRVDLVITGGANVYPAEVEAVLTEHPSVRDVAVIGLPDDEWGQRVHAIIALSAEGAGPTVEDLTAHCRARLATYKAPKSYEFVDRLPRDDGGKLRRSALVSERV